MTEISRAGIEASPTSVFAYASTRVPVAVLGETVGEVRRRLVGGDRLGYAAEVAVVEAVVSPASSRSRTYWRLPTRRR